MRSHTLSLSELLLLCKFVGYLFCSLNKKPQKTSFVRVSFHGLKQHLFYIITSKCSVHLRGEPHNSLHVRVPMSAVIRRSIPYVISDHLGLRTTPTRPINGHTIRPRIQHFHSTTWSLCWLTLKGVKSNSIQHQSNISFVIRCENIVEFVSAGRAILLSTCTCRKHQLILIQHHSNGMAKHV